jgi:hypothetical protein
MERLARVELPEDAPESRRSFSEEDLRQLLHVEPPSAPPPEGEAVS